MDFFTKNRITAGIISLLVILNMSSLAMLWHHQIRAPHFPRRNEDMDPDKMQAYLEKELNLTKEQAQQFKDKRDTFFSQSRAVQDKIHDLRKQIMDESFSSKPDSAKVEKLANEIGAKEAEREKLLFAHFNELSSICKPEQKEKFKSILQDFIKKMGPQMQGFRSRRDHGGKCPPNKSGLQESRLPNKETDISPLPVAPDKK